MLELQPEKLDVLVDGERIEPIYVAKAIQHQLAERLKFVKPPDASVASLLFDYAAIEATTATLESAKGVLDLALKYGYPPVICVLSRALKAQKSRACIVR